MSSLVICGNTADGWDWRTGDVWKQHPRLQWTLQLTRQIRIVFASSTWWQSIITMYSTGRWRPYISISVWWDRISSQTAQPVHPHFSCGSTATDLLSLGIMKEICCNSYCVSHINFTFETKCRQFILAVVIWRWHWVRWGMIKHSTSQPCGLKCMQSDPLLSFLERWRKAFLSALVLHKKKRHVPDSFGKTKEDGREFKFVFLQPQGRQIRTCHML